LRIAMKTKIYLDNEDFIAGITMKDENEPESNNMALHACVNTDHIMKNRKKLAALLQCSLDDFVCSYQTHSSNFHKVTLSDKGRGSETMDTAIPDTDALYTYEENIVLCCFTADCVPVIFYNRETGMMGVIHSGWQGTVKEITPKVLVHLIQYENCDPSDLKVYIGSALSGERFEVDQDVFDKFKSLGYADDYIYWNEKNRKYHIDNQLVVKKQCELHGVKPDHIEIHRTCTYTNPDGFSFRQDKNCGRHLSFIMKKDTTGGNNEN